MQNKILMIVFLLLMGYSAEAQLTDGPIDGGGGTTKYYYDGDRDGYGNPNSAYVTTPTTNYVPNNTDCNDGSAAINPTTRWYYDHDGDGRGRTSPMKIQCTKPANYVLYNDDRDDNNVHITHIAPRYFYRDYDRDGFGNPNNKVYRSVMPSGYVTNKTDCNDGNININPNTVWYRDVDGDGRGNASVTTRSCTKPSGYVNNNDDINDGDEYITNIPPRYFYIDGDLDTFGSPAAATRVYHSVRPSGYVTNNLDCDDGNINIHPNTIWYEDFDKDGSGNPSVTKQQCGQPLGYVINKNDCDDRDVNIHPNTVWYYDNDGDGFASSTKTQCTSPGSKYTSEVLPITDCNDNDEITNPDTAWYYDNDGDGFASSIKHQCTSPGSKYTRSYKPVTDCNDDNIDVHPNTVWYYDNDGDGFASGTTTQCIRPSRDYYLTPMPLGDCDESDPTINPDTVWYYDGDGDGFASSTKKFCKSPGVNYTRTPIPVTDCNDDDPTINPDTVWYKDGDGDGYAISTVNSCTNPGTGYTRTELPLTDCNDGDGTINPETVWYKDGDNDGFGDPNNTQIGCMQPTGYIRDNTDKCPEEYGEHQGCVNTLHSLSLSSNKNYVFTRSYLKEMNSSDEIQFNKDVIETVTYFDGLGRPKQQTAIKTSPTEADIITHIEYDEVGRQAKQYLPFAKANQGSYTAVNITADINQYYLDTYAADFAGITNPAQVNAYSETIFEDSPLNRTLEQGAPGKDWKADPISDTDHTIKSDWKYNIANEVMRFDVTFTANDIEQPVLSQNGYYTANELYVSITKDENWTPADVDNRTTREYRDKHERVILKRVFNNGDAHDTYYVYDRFNQLSFVITPKVNVTDGVSATELGELCYQYRYDYRNRLIEKKIPGKELESIVYDKQDRPILTQDALLAAENTWLFTKYDAYGRIAYTGKYTDSRSRKLIQIEINTTVDPETIEKRKAETTINGAKISYSSNAFPTTNIELLTINYYDDYNFDRHGMDKPVSVYGVATTDRVRSLPTGTKVRVLGTNNWITTVTAYDNKARAIWIGNRNHYLSTIDKTSMKLDFTGRVEETTTSHVKNGSTPLITVDKFTYDHTGRLLTQTQKINDQDVEMIVNNTYDELGQLVSKKVGGLPSAEVTRSAGLQTVDYSYNIRGWLKTINNPNNLGDDLFAFGIAYNNGANPLYNGNISQTSWKTANDNYHRWYNYEYDALNRLTTANSHSGNFDVSSITYDKMGNIESLSRNGFVGGNTFNEMDNLSYTYDSGNKLQKVTDTGNDNYGFKDGTNTNNDFEYDANGNMIIDRNKGISSITYNHLNLPETVSISNSEGTGTIAYIYDATGAKQKKIVTEGSSITTEYAGNYVYKNGNLEFFNQAEGIVEKEADGYKYVYQFKDHLDNIRLSYKDANKDGSITQNEIVQEKNYYPFGLRHKGYNEVLRGRNHSYGFIGKEEQDEYSLAWMDFGARNYEASLGRWMNIDNMSEKFYDWTPYKYSLNNPILFMDPDGNCETCWKAIKKYYGGVWNGFKNTYVTAGSAIKKAVVDPVGVAKTAVTNHIERVKNPIKLFKDAKDAVSTFNPQAAILDDIVTGVTSDDPIAAVSNQQGARFANSTMELAGEGVGVVFSRIARLMKGAKNVVTPKINFSNTMGSRVWAYVNNKAVGFFDQGINGSVSIELNIPSELKGLGIGSDIFAEAVKGMNEFKALWVKSDIYQTGISDNLVQYQKGIENGLSKTDAAWNTWSGQQAAKNGFTKAIVKEVENGVNVSFSR